MALLSIQVCNQISKSEQQTSYMYWNSEKKLSWDDFKGTAPKGKSDCIAAFMGLSPLINIKNDSLVKVKVFATFNRDSSWVKPNCKSLLLLEDEQNLFDINEIYARKTMSYLQIHSFQYVDMKKVMKQYNSEKDSLMALYVKDVQASVLNQNKWENRIDSMLMSIKKQSWDSVYIYQKRV